MKGLMFIVLMVTFSIGITFWLWLCRPSKMTATVTPVPDKSTIIPDKITIKYFNDKVFRPIEDWEHKGHYVKISCITCHHKWKIDEKDNPRKCIECHTLYPKEPYKTSSLRPALHNSCKKCHCAEKDSIAPTICKGGCHK